LAQFGFVKNASDKVVTNASHVQPLVLEEGLSCSQVEEALQVLASDPNIAYAAPYFLEGNQLLGLTNEALVTVEPGEKDRLQKLAKQYNAKVLKALADNVYVVQVDKNAKGNALALANFMQGKKGIAQAEPDFIIALNQ